MSGDKYRSIFDVKASTYHSTQNGCVALFLAGIVCFVIVGLQWPIWLCLPVIAFFIALAVQKTKADLR